MVSIKRTQYYLDVFIDGVLHLHLNLSNQCSFQTWLKGDKEGVYYVQLYRKEGEPITLEYYNRELWEKIINYLSENL